MLGNTSEEQNGFVCMFKPHYSTIPAFHHSKLQVETTPTEMIFLKA